MFMITISAKRCFVLVVDRAAHLATTSIYIYILLSLLVFLPFHCFCFALNNLTLFDVFAQSLYFIRYIIIDHHQQRTNNYDHHRVITINFIFMTHEQFFLRISLDSISSQRWSPSFARSPVIRVQSNLVFTDANDSRRRGRTLCIRIIIRVIATAMLNSKVNPSAAKPLSKDRVSWNL